MSGAPVAAQAEPAISPAEMAGAGQEQASSLRQDLNKLRQNFDNDTLYGALLRAVGYERMEEAIALREQAQGAAKESLKTDQLALINEQCPGIGAARLNKFVEDNSLRLHSLNAENLIRVMQDEVGAVLTTPKAQELSNKLKEKHADAEAQMEGFLRNNANFYQQNAWISARGWKLLFTNLVVSVLGGPQAVLGELFAQLYNYVRAGQLGEETTRALGALKAAVRKNPVLEDDLSVSASGSDDDDDDAGLGAGLGAGGAGLGGAGVAASYADVGGAMSSPGKQSPLGAAMAKKKAAASGIGRCV